MQIEPQTFQCPNCVADLNKANQKEGFILCEYCDKKIQIKNNPPASPFGFMPGMFMAPLFTSGTNQATVVINNEEVGASSPEAAQDAQSEMADIFPDFPFGC